MFSLKQEKVDEKLALFIAEKVFHELDSQDIRDVVKISRLIHNLRDIDFIIKAMK